MKRLSAITISLALGLSFSSISAMDEKDRIELLETAVIETASTPAQKSAVAEYMANVAREKMELAQSFRDKANSARGGKAITQMKEKAELLRKAEVLEKEAERYKKSS